MAFIYTGVVFKQSALVFPPKNCWSASPFPELLQHTGMPAETVKGNKAKPPRHGLSKEAKAIRNALYAGRDAYHLPTLPEKEAVHRAILDLFDPHTDHSWYNAHRHLSWCSSKETQLKSKLAKGAGYNTSLYEDLRTKLAHTPDPPMSLICTWAAELGIPATALFEKLQSLISADQALTPSTSATASIQSLQSTDMMDAHNGETHRHAGTDAHGVSHEQGAREDAYEGQWWSMEAPESNMDYNVGLGDPSGVYWSMESTGESWGGAGPSGLPGHL
ncbi:hypothetical protein C8Q77DRAFT_1273853 [Trametes polyzona]|nr:hypothetical protein C8Q77DRAFT_1273853 [Trametes polyzona]